MEKKRKGEENIELISEVAALRVFFVSSTCSLWSWYFCSHSMTELFLFLEKPGELPFNVKFPKDLWLKFFGIKNVQKSVSNALSWFIFGVT